MLAVWLKLLVRPTKANPTVPLTHQIPISLEYALPATKSLRESSHAARPMITRDILLPGLRNRIQSLIGRYFPAESLRALTLTFRQVFLVYQPELVRFHLMAPPSPN
uniref:Uncharacterized protein n=1 Tax=Bionectria ochroleuca TaxID=29856 RepID=A0A8H7TQQ0_BIOOC